MDRHFLMIIKLNLIYVWSDFITDNVHAKKIVNWFHLLSGNFYGMKAVLSYHHSSQKTQNRLRDVDHLLVVPFVEVARSSMPK